MAIPKELKEAILMMPQKEKDKLLLRLVGKDELLSEQLRVQLLCDQNYILEERQKVYEKITRYVRKFTYNTAGWLLMDIRSLSGYINNHSKITKDKHGEIVLQLHLMESFITKFRDNLEEDVYDADTFAKDLVNRCYKYYTQILKLHEDFYIEFEAQMNTILNFIHSYKACKPFLQEKKLPKKFN